MEEFSFEHLVRIRKQWVQTSQENNFDFESILAGIYNDPSHFVYEILQNAEDAGAIRVEFNLFDDRLEIVHDGQDFNTQDIDAITGIGISTKKDDVNTIGKFGVGFKSVFAITKTPIIQSGEYHIQIDDFVIPSKISAHDRIHDTKITLLFNHETRQPIEIYDLVASKLQNLGLRTLLFLRNIDEIQWTTSTNSGHYLKSTDEVKGLPTVKRIEIIAESDHEETFNQYIVLRKDFELEKKDLRVEIAFQVEDAGDKTIVVPVQDPKLVVFFPTERVTFLKFLVQGPYRTTPNRENIPLDVKQNVLITQKIAELVAESIPSIKKMGLLDVNFLNILPLERLPNENDPIYTTIFESVRDKFLSEEELLPTSDGSYVKTNNALLARGHDLTTLLSTDDLRILFKRTAWLDPSIASDRNRILRNYIFNDLNVREVDFEAFAKSLDELFIASKSDGWLANFYDKLIDQRALWQKDRYQYRQAILREKPIIRLEDDSHVSPFDGSGNVQAYLPTDTVSLYPTVKRSVIASNESALEFLQELGLTQPDLFAEIREFVIPRYESTPLFIDDAQYLGDIRIFLQAYAVKTNSNWQELLSDLKRLQIIKAVDLGGQRRFMSPGEVYANNNHDLNTYFAGSTSVYFVDKELYTNFGNLNEFLMELGVATVPRRIKIDPLLSYSEKSQLRAKWGDTSYSKEIYVEDFRLDKLRNFFEHPVNRARSLTLWRLLIASLNHFDKYRSRSYFEGEYCWYYYKRRTQPFESSFTKMLQETAWLFDSEGKLCQPSAITLDQLAADYNLESPHINVLKEKLGFRSEIYEQLPEHDQQILELTQGVKLEELKQALAIINAKKSAEQQLDEGDGAWVPDQLPTDVQTAIEEVRSLRNKLPKVPKADAKSGTELANDTDGVLNSDSADDDKPQEDKIGRQNTKAIGHWGESYVFEALKTEYAEFGEIQDTEFGCLCFDGNDEVEVHWLNIESDRGRGCDFILKQGIEQIEYIEVKATTKDTEELIPITGHQWGLAQKLYEQGDGYKYVIYRVLNAGKSDARIKKLRDPYKLFQEGKLHAHPVNLEL